MDITQKSAACLAAVDHFSGLGRAEIDVPEWDAKIFSKPITVADRAKLFHKQDRGPVEYQVDLIILKSELEDGSPAFGPQDRAQLLNSASGEVIDRVVAAIENHGSKLPLSVDDLAFVYRLADRLNKTVGELMTVLSTHELEGWKTYLKAVEGR